MRNILSRNFVPTREAIAYKTVRSIEAKRRSDRSGLAFGAFFGGVAGAVTASAGLSASDDAGEQMMTGPIIAVAGIIGTGLGGLIGHVIDRAQWTRVIPGR